MGRVSERRADAGRAGVGAAVDPREMWLCACSRGGSTPSCLAFHLLEGGFDPRTPGRTSGRAGVRSPSSLAGHLVARRSTPAGAGLVPHREGFDARRAWPAICSPGGSTPASLTCAPAGGALTAVVGHVTPDLRKEARCPANQVRRYPPSCSRRWWDIAVPGCTIAIRPGHGDPAEEGSTAGEDRVQRPIETGYGVVA